MNNNLPIENKNTFLNKIKEFFISIFRKKIKEKTVGYETENETNKTPSFIMDLQGKAKAENVNEKDVLDFTVEIIEKQPEVLNDFTIEKLEEIKDYYDEQISRVDKEIEKIRKN